MAHNDNNVSGRIQVCVVGAGICGLNALAVATEYAGADDRVMVADARPRPGGMWVDTYDYVRLHQPHPLFTAGDVKWDQGYPRHYLATKPEVLRHFDHCLDVMSRRCRLETRWGWSYVAHQEHADGVSVTFRDPAGETHVVEAARLIKAFGLKIPHKDPLAVSSTKVRSVSPDTWDVRGDEVTASDAPIWIIGGGKTAMDTAYAALRSLPGRRIGLVAGRGMAFARRDQLLPSGARRWSPRVPDFNTVFAELARRFDGTNEAEALAWFRATYCHSVVPDAAGMMLGLLSDEERDTIMAGLDHVVPDRFVDAVDTVDSTELRFLDHPPVDVPAGTWVVNCTGYLAREHFAYEPYLSAGGRVLSVNQHSLTAGFTSHAGYFMAHLFLRGDLPGLPLYELDTPALLARSNDAVVTALAALIQYNLGLMLDVLPAKVFLSWGTDFARWLPPHRRAISAGRFALAHKRDREHHRRSLDRLRERYGVRCGPLGLAETAERAVQAS